MVLNDDQLQFKRNSLGLLTPSDSVTVPLESTIVADMTNNATVAATPVTTDLVPIPGLANGTDSTTF